MTCDAFRDALFETLRGRPAGDGPAAHRSSCAPCARLAADIEANERVLRSARAPKAPPGTWAAIARELEKGRALPFRRLRIASWAAAAAVALLALSAFSSGPRAPRASLDLVVVEVRPESRRVFEPFLPSYGGSAGLLAVAGGPDRADR
jgi:hypothetical protein